MMQINWAKYIADKIPRPLRDARLFGLLMSFFAPLKQLYNDLLSYNNSVRYKLDHTSQVWSIEAVLNDAFDIDNRRIRIEDAGGWMVTLVNLDTDLDAPLINLDEDGEPVLIIHDDSAYEGGEYDFIIVMPFVLSAPDMFRLKALVNFYRLGGMQYQVIVE